MLELAAELLILGLVTGCIYALCAVGVTLIFGVVDIVNVAHGEFFALGGYAALLVIAAFGVHPAFEVAAALLAAGLLGLVAYHVLIAPMQRRVQRRVAGTQFLVLTLGLSIFLQSAMLAVAGGNYVPLPAFARGVLDLGFTFVSYQRLIIVAATVVAIGALFLFLRFHRDGQAMRAVAQNPDAAASVGIRLDRIFRLTVVIGVALAGLAGVLMAPLVNVYPMVGFQFTIKAFAIVILGGLGNVAGTVLASFLLSYAEIVALLVLPAEWRDAVAFIVMLGVLVLRPQGLMRGSAA